MRIIRGLKNLKKEHTPTVVTIGNFDGVHKGHQALLDLLFEKVRSSVREAHSSRLNRNLGSFLLERWFQLD